MPSNNVTNLNFSDIKLLLTIMQMQLRQGAGEGGGRVRNINLKKLQSHLVAGLKSH